MKIFNGNVEKGFTFMLQVSLEGKEGREGNSFGVDTGILAAKCLSEMCSVTVKALLNV